MVAVRSILPSRVRWPARGALGGIGRRLGSLRVLLTPFAALRANMRPIVAELGQMGGIGLVCAGLWTLSQPVGMIAAGAALFLVAASWDRPGPPPDLDEGL